jgi:hypothetical protein
MRQGCGHVGSGLLGIGVILVSLLSTWGSQGWGGKLEDLLLENKQITVDQWVQLKAEEEKRQAKELEERRGSGDIPLRERWYEKISIRGYSQFRYNHTLDNDELRGGQDRSIGDTNELFIRRARLVISGQPHERIFFYFQPSFEGLIGGVEQAGVVRDLYADLFLAQNKEWRIRAGLSKIPFGFENMQSSQNRLAFDRNDALNSGVPGERDLGLYLYYTPTSVRERFKRLVDSGLKGSGDYGMLGVGVYNGQGINVRDRNKNKHVAFHAAYPYEFPDGQIIQVGMDAYAGQINVATQSLVPANPLFSPTNGQAIAVNPVVRDGGNYLDQRIAWHFVLFPQPFGLQAEYTIGRGPELSADRTEVVTGNIRGGYVQLFYQYKCDAFCLSVIPYVRYQEYFGGRKFEANAPRNSVRELELGIEYQFNKALELTVAGTFSSRTSSDAQFLPAACTNNLSVDIACTQTPYQRQTGNMLRFQLQWNF